MIDIDYQLLEPDTLDNILAEFVLREATDYGDVEVSFDEKKQQLYQRLKTGHDKIIYDSETDQCDIVPAI